MCLLTSPFSLSLLLGAFDPLHIDLLVHQFVDKCYYLITLHGYQYETRTGTAINGGVSSSSGTRVNEVLSIILDDLVLVCMSAYEYIDIQLSLHRSQCF